MQMLHGVHYVNQPMTDQTEELSTAQKVRV